MALHPLRVADAAATTKLDPVTLEALVKRNALVLAPGESLSGITQGTGEVALAVIAGTLGQVFFYDSTDSTTADDGITCLVDGSGHRYHIEDSATINVSAVISETNTPPGGPTVGDKYIVGTSPTGAWAAQAKNIAIYTRRGWVYATPDVGTTVLNRDTDTNRQYLDTGLWGAFVTGLDDGSITPPKLSFPMGLAVEAQQNSPPGSPTVGLYYIVGTVPTGAWVGHSNAVATYVSGAWTYLAAYEGARVFDRTNDVQLYYTGSAWSGVSSSSIQEFTTAGAATWTKPSLGTSALVELWAGGGSGARDSADNAGGGGGGGGYVSHIFKLSDLGSTESLSIAAGGASRTSDNTAGATGGNTTFGSWLTAYGGGGGGIGTSSAGGGGGGGDGGVGTVGSTADGGAGGADLAGSGAGNGGVGAAGGNATTRGAGAGGGAGNPSNVGRAGGKGYDGGGGGGGGGDTGFTGGAGGTSVNGGGGGGGARRTGTGSAGAGGVSKFGGSGGAGAGDSTNATAGSQPGGGGGGSATGNSGKGGDGKIRVTVF